MSKNKAAAKEAAQKKINDFFATYGLLSSIEKLNGLLTDSLTLYSSDGYNTDPKETQNNVHFIGATIELLTAISENKE